MLYYICILVILLTTIMHYICTLRCAFFVIYGIIMLGDNMKCPNCNKEMKNNYCMVCGYMQNGNFVGECINEKNNDIKIYQKNFDIMNQNENKILTMLMGPIYMSYKGYLVLGVILSILDIFFMYLTIYIFSLIPFTISLSFLGFILYLLISRIIFMSFFNSLCLYIDNIKIKRIVKKYKNSYKNKLYKHNNKIIFMILNILIYIIVIILVNI